MKIIKRLVGFPALLAVLGVFALPAPNASANECAVKDLMCAWSGSEWNGELSWWYPSDFGCHNHANNPKLRSFWNDTPYTVRIGGWGNLGPGLGLQIPSGDYITGEICWPV